MEQSEKQSFRVLIVDDNSKNIQVLGKVLQEDSIEIEFALDAQSGLQWIRDSSFDLVLLDINMPDMDGIEMCRLIRKDKSLDTMPIIFLSAQTDRASVLKGFEAGAQDYIAKPFERRELLARVRTQLEIKRNREQISRYANLIEQRNKQTTESIRYARSIQQAILQSSLCYNEGSAETFIIYQPRDIVSGDFYYFQSMDSTYIMGVFDGLGHGIPGGFISMLGYSMLNDIIIREKCFSPGDILGKIRSRFIQAFHLEGKLMEIKAGMDGSIISYDMKTGVVRFSGAYSNIYLYRDKQVMEFKGDNMPLTYHMDMREFQTQEFNVQKNDILYLLTDGYTDQFGGPSDKKFSRRRFRSLIKEIGNQPLSAQKEALEQAVQNWRRNTEQTDDITIAALKI